MIVGLTRRQHELHAFITRYALENDGVSPSYDEMKSALRLASKSGVNRLINSLEERGLLVRLPHQARAVKAVPILEGLPTPDVLDELPTDQLWAFADRVHAAIDRRESAA